MARRLSEQPQFNDFKILTKSNQSLHMTKTETETETETDKNNFNDNEIENENEIDDQMDEIELPLDIQKINDIHAKRKKQPNSKYNTNHSQGFQPVYSLIYMCFCIKHTCAFIYIHIYRIDKDEYTAYI